jgi:hypothetical protein
VEEPPKATYSKRPPAFCFPNPGEDPSDVNTTALELPKRSAVGDIACNLIVPAEMERFPVKLESEPKVRSVPAATVEAVETDNQSVFPMILVTKDPLGTLVPEMFIPIPIPAVELTTNMLDPALPAERVVTVPPTIVAVEAWAYTQVPVSALNKEVAPPFWLMRPEIWLAAALVPPRTSVLAPEPLAETPLTKVSGAGPA